MSITLWVLLPQAQRENAIANAQIVQLKDKSDADAMEDSLNEHVQTRVRMYKTYEPDQVDRASSAVVKTIGDCMLLIMSDAPQNAETAFKEFTK